MVIDIAILQISVVAFVAGVVCTYLLYHMESGICGRSLVGLYTCAIYGTSRLQNSLSSKYLASKGPSRKCI